MGKITQRFSVNPEMGEVDAVSAKISEIVRKVAGNDSGFRAGLVIIEVCVNIVKYGRSRSGKIEIELSFEAGGIKITIRDDSYPFNPLKMNDPDLENIETLQKGGMGIYLIKRFSKKVDYVYENDKNVVTVTI